MRASYLLILGSLIVGACADTPTEDQGQEEVATIENQVEGDAKSLEAAADEAVQELKSEIEADLSADGVVNSTSSPAENRQ